MIESRLTDASLARRECFLLVYLTLKLSIIKTLIRFFCREQVVFALDHFFQN
jgi:hypothetical protein